MKFVRENLKFSANLSKEGPTSFNVLNTLQEQINIYQDFRNCINSLNEEIYVLNNQATTLSV